MNWRAGQARGFHREGGSLLWIVCVGHDDSLAWDGFWKQRNSIVYYRDLLRPNAAGHQDLAHMVRHGDEMPRSAVLPSRKAALDGEGDTPGDDQRRGREQHAQRMAAGVVRVGEVALPRAAADVGGGERPRVEIELAGGVEGRRVVRRE